MKIDYDVCKLIINGILFGIILFNHLKIIQIPLFTLKIAILLLLNYNNNIDIHLLIVILIKKT